MADPTQPGKGAKNWHIPTDGNFTLLDGRIDTLDDVVAAFNTEANLVAAGHNDTDPATAAGKISLEVKDARGSLGSLDGRLDISLNEDGTLKTSTTSGDQWPTQGMTNPTYVSSATFKVDGDATGILQPGTSLKVDFNVSGLVYLHVKSSSYAAGPDETTVTVWDDEAVLNETIDEVAWGFVRNNEIGLAGSPGSSIRDLERSSFEVYYYDGTAYDDPWDESGGRVAKAANDGHLARVDYASGLQVGFEYASADDDADLALEERKLNGTLIETWTPTFDGTSGNIIDYDRS
jgi:hypothetical protein